MKTVKIPGIVVLMVPFIIYIIYWFIMQSIKVFNDMSLCYCTKQGLNEAPPTFWERFFSAAMIILIMFLVLIAIEYIINIWTRHLKEEQPPYIIAALFIAILYIPTAIVFGLYECFKYINDKLTINIKY